MKGFEGTAEPGGNLGQAFHFAFNDVSSEFAFIPSGSEIFVSSIYYRKKVLIRTTMVYTRQQHHSFRKAQLSSKGGRTVSFKSPESRTLAKVQLGRSCTEQLHALLAICVPPLTSCYLLEKTLVPYGHANRCQGR